MNQRILLPPALSPLPPPSFLQKKTIKFLISSWQTNKVGRISGWLQGSFLSSAGKSFVPGNDIWSPKCINRPGE